MNEKIKRMNEKLRALIFFFFCRLKKRSFFPLFPFSNSHPFPFSHASSSPLPQRPRVLLGRDKRAVQPVHVHEIVTVVVPVGRVMNGMIPGAHDRLALCVEAIVDRIRPDRRQEKQQLVREEVAGDEAQTQSVGHGLGDAVERGEGEPSKGAQRRLLVVLVVDVVQSLVARPPVVEPPVDPVNAPLNKRHVGDDEEEVGKNAPDVVDPRERRRPAALGGRLDERGQESVQGHGLRRDLDLFEDGGARGHRDSLCLVSVGSREEGVAKDPIDVVDPDSFFFFFF